MTAHTRIDQTYMCSNQRWKVQNANDDGFEVVVVDALWTSARTTSKTGRCHSPSTVPALPNLWIERDSQHMHPIQQGIIHADGECCSSLAKPNFQAELHGELGGLPTRLLPAGVYLMTTRMRPPAALRCARRAPKVEDEFSGHPSNTTFSLHGKR